MEQRLEKAAIKILDGQQAGESLEVLFNPSEYTHEISNNYKQEKIPGTNNPVLEFVNGELQTLSMELFFDTWTDGQGADVSEITNRIAALLAVDSSLHEPPKVEFRWGNLVFKAVIVTLSQRFTMFNAGGKPVRATLNVTFKQYQTLREQLENPRRNSADKTKRRTLTADDNLWLLAAREYGHPREWRRIARNNGIANPRLTEPGTVLALPPLDQ